MKSQFTAAAVLLQLTTLINAAAVLHAHDARQAPAAEMSSGMRESPDSPAKPPPALPKVVAPMFAPPRLVSVVSRVPKPATIRPKEATRVRVSYGPFELLAKGAKKPPGSLDPNGQSENFLILDGLCTAAGAAPKDCTVLGGNIMLTDKAGDIIGPKEGVYTHHFISTNIDKAGLVPPLSRCPIGDSPPPGMPDLPAGEKLPFSPFLGRGEDGGLVDYLYTPVAETAVGGSGNSSDAPIDFGYHLRKGDKVVLNADLVNYKGDSQQLYVTYEIEYVDGLRGEDTSSGLISVGGCNIFAKPNISNKGRTETVGKAYNVITDATIVSARGHLHPGGEKMQLKVNDKLVCESMAEYDDGGYISAMSLCPKTIELKKDDRVSMVSVYDVQKHPLRPGAGPGDTFAASAFGGGPDIMGMWLFAYGEK